MNVTITITTAKRKSGYQAKVKYDGIGIVDCKHTGHETREKAVIAAREDIKRKADNTLGGSDWVILEIKGK